MPQNQNLFKKGTKHCEQKRKLRLSPFSTIFSKAFVLPVVKSQDCLVKY